MKKIETGTLAYIRYLLSRNERNHWYVRLWCGVMLIRHGKGLATRVSAPGHPENHVWWLRLEAPLSGGRCWWCGLGCYPGPLLGYGQWPAPLTQWMRSRLWAWGFRP